MLIRTHIFKPILIFLLAACTVSQENRVSRDVLIPDSPESAGMSSERLAKIDGLINQYLDSGWIPGAVALVARDNKIVYRKSFGFRDLESGDSMKTDDIFRIASMTKAITSTGVMMLYEDGKFLLDDPVSKYIPSFKDPVILVKSNPDGSFTSKKAKKEVTIRQLLTHTSGIGYGFTDPDLKPIYDKAGIPDGFVLTNTTLEKAMTTMGKMPLLFEPGEQFHYGLSVDVLGYLIEVVSGMPLDRFFQERIFKPLDMTDTYFYPPDDKLNRLAVIYAEDKDGITRSTDDRYNYPFEGEKKYFSGGAGLCSTALDYAKFLSMFANHGVYNGQQVLSPKTIDLMQHNQVGNLRDENGFGLGFGITDEKGSVGNMWWGGYFHTHFWVDRKEKLVGVLMLQMSPVIHGDIDQKFQVLVYQSITR